MNKYVLLLVLLLPLSGFSQNSAPPPSAPPTASAPAPTPQPLATPLGSPRQAQRAVAASTQNIREFETLGKLEEELELAEEARKRQDKVKLARRMIDELYRKPTKKEMLTVAVDNDLREKFTDFLRLKNTGLIRLLNDTGCAENTNVVVASDNCLKNTMPGAGASFSFRINNYRIPRLADLGLTQNAFVTTGDWLHGILVNIGDVSLESVNFQTSGVGFINDFQPIVDVGNAREFDSKLSEGIKNDGFTYCRKTPARENQSYILRSIAYRGNILKSANGVRYNELDYDKRKDVLIAFRVVRKHQDGSLTLLWKRLAIKNSPKLIVKNVAGNRGQGK